MQPRPWQIAAPSPQKQQALARDLGIHPITAQVLINRGIEIPDEAMRFLQPRLSDLPNPFSLLGMRDAVARIIKAIDQGERIALYGDYDVDGVTGTALLARFLRTAGCDPLIFIPHRLRDGYGVSKRGIKELRKKEAQLIITIDNGIRAEEEIRFAREQGIDVIITDHHDFDRLPDAAYAVINPKRGSSSEQMRVLSGCGVAFFLAMALRKELRNLSLFQQQEPNLKSLLDLVAIGTIADVVPLTGPNRILTMHGLAQLAKTEHVGLQALMNKAGLSMERVNMWGVGYTIAPRLNAAGRMDDAQLACDLLLTDNPRKAEELAIKLHTLNERRREIQERVIKEATSQFLLSSDADAIVTFAPHWEVGVIGIAAAKLVEEFERPAIVIGGAGEHAKGSVRSIRGLNIVDCLNRCSDYLIQFGGHAQAAGLVIAPENIEPFRQAFIRVCAEQMNQLAPEGLQIDAEVHPAQITAELINEIERFEPYGIGNPEPLFCAHAQAPTNAKVVGENHIKFQLVGENYSIDAIGFNMATKRQALHPPCSLAFSPQFNIFNGVRQIQLKIREMARDV